MSYIIIVPSYHKQTAITFNYHPITTLWLIILSHQTHRSQGRQVENHVSNDTAIHETHDNANGTLQDLVRQRARGEDRSEDRAE